MAAAGTGLAALMVYLAPGLAAPGAHWPLWDVRVYWWGGQQAARGGTLYAPGARYSFTYPPFAAVIFSVAARAPEGALAAVITAGSVGALAAFCTLALGAAGVQRRPGTVFATSALALLTWPVAYTLHLGEINLIVAAMAGTDLLRRRDGGWWQGIATGPGRRDQAHPAHFRGLPADHRASQGRHHRGRNVRRNHRCGCHRAALAISDILARRRALAPGPDRQPGQPLRPVPGRSRGPAG